MEASRGIGGQCYDLKKENLEAILCIGKLKKEKKVKIELMFLQYFHVPGHSIRKSVLFC